KRGYRFVAQVVIDGGDAAVVPATAPAPLRRRLSSVAMAGLAAAAIVVVGTVASVARRPAPPSGPSGALTPVRVSTSGSGNVEPALSPDGSAIAFTSNRSGSFEIYVAGLAPGSQEIAITRDGANNMQPAWSPDGQWIAFYSRNGGGLWIVPSTGGAPRQL